MRRLPAFVLIALSLAGDLAVGGVLAASITGTGRADVLRGTQKGDRLDGRAGNDRLSGLSGADTLIGGPGNDTLVGGPGSDTYRCGPGRDTVVGEAGEKAGADCEAVRGIAAPSPTKPPAPAPPPPPAPEPPPGPATLISFAVCPASGTTLERGQYVCTSSSAGRDHHRRQPDLLHRELHQPRRVTRLDRLPLRRQGVLRAPLEHHRRERRDVPRMDVVRVPGRVPGRLLGLPREGRRQGRRRAGVHHGSLRAKAASTGRPKRPLSPAVEITQSRATCRGATPRPVNAAAPHRAAKVTASCASRPAPSANVRPAMNESPAP